MAKNITREMTLYVYTFAKVDSANCQVFDVEVIESGEAIGVRRLAEIGKEKGGKLCVSSTKKEFRYSLPIDRFIEACKEYAKEIEEAHENGASDDDTNND